MKKVLLVPFLVLFVVIAACSKGTSAGGSGDPGALGSAILSSIPETSLGFLVWDVSSDGYQKFKASPWAKQSGQTLEMLKNMQVDEGGEEVKKIIAAIEKSGLINQSPDAPDVVSGAVAFFDAGVDGKTPGLGLYATAAKGSDLKAKTAQLETLIKELGGKTEKATIEGAEGFAIIPPQEVVEGPSPIKKILVVATADKLAATSNEKLASNLFKPEGPTGIAKIKASAQFEKARKSAAPDQSQFAYGYFDIVQAINVASKMDPTGGAAINSAEVPVESLIYARSMADSLADTLSVSLNPKTDEQKKWVQVLNGSGNTTLGNRVPSNVTALIGLDGKTIGNIKNAALATMSEGERAMMGAMLGPVDMIQGLGLAVRNASGASPFPEIMLVAESNKAAELEGFLKSQVQMLTAGGGMPLSPWKEMDVEGSKISFSLTPFGVGLYMGQAGDSVVVASSEQAVRDLVSTGKSTKGLLAGSNSKVKELMTAKPPLLVAYSNFDKVATMIQSTNESLAMFTGGQSMIDQKQMDMLKTMGTLVFSLNFGEGVLQLQSTYEAPGAKG